MSIPLEKPSRRTQEERTATTRKALLDATVDCLIEYGYHGTTTTRVVERAGVSRGAQVHHFPTKNELVMAAVQHLSVKRAAGFLERIREVRMIPDDWIGDTLDLVWDVHQGPYFEASMELWIASRTDPTLREQVASFERLITGGFIEMGRLLIGDRVDEPEYRADIYMVLETIRGLRMLSFVHPSEPDRIDARWQNTKTRLRLTLEHWTTVGP